MARMGNDEGEEIASRRPFGLFDRSVDGRRESTDVIERPISVSGMDIETQLARWVEKPE
ncbi:MAG: hypothetical protein KAT58_13190 [candidate division Zixibacteria bacterium]|nr:hypothetical protein [candidate division Zixibacteria bacterium]